jgi:hypothetical protein
MRPPIPSAPTQALRAGDIAFARMEKVNSELVAITYGAIISQLLRSNRAPRDVEADVMSIGENMGARMIEEFLAKSNQGPCQNFREVIESISKIGAKMFLGIDTEFTELGPKTYVLSFSENPLNDFVELPDDLKNGSFSYSAIYCGIIQGALEQLHLQTKCTFVKDTLRGDDSNAIRIDLVSVKRPEDEDE